MREFEQHVAVYLHLLTMLAHFLFRALELIVRSHEFGRALGHSPLKRRVELTNFAFRTLALRARAERHHSIRQIVREGRVLLNRTSGEVIGLFGLKGECTERFPVGHQGQGNARRVPAPERLHSPHSHIRIS